MASVPASPGHTKDVDHLVTDRIRSNKNPPGKAYSHGLVYDTWAENMWSPYRSPNAVALAQMPGPWTVSRAACPACQIETSCRCPGREDAQTSIGWLLDATLREHRMRPDQLDEGRQSIRAVPITVGQ